MHADAHFVMGRTHLTTAQPCQDYATAGDLPSGAYAVVADGCSSGGATDVGARLVALATVQALTSPAAKLPEVAAAQQAAVLADTAARLGLVQDDLLATCVSAVVRGDTAFVHLQGDGAVAWQYPSGDIEMVSVEWERNTPCYPAYAADGFAGFIAYHGGDLTAERWDAKTWRRQDGQLQPAGHARYTLEAGLTGLTIALDPTELVRMAVFSDGVTQVAGQHWPQVVSELMGFKVLAGSFVKRRLGRYVRDVSVGSNQGPIDDLAFAAIDLERRDDA
jgi:hypothetical protein